MQSRTINYNRGIPTLSHSMIQPCYRFAVRNTFAFVPTPLLSGVSGGSAANTLQKYPCRIWHNRGTSQKYNLRIGAVKSDSAPDQLDASTIHLISDLTREVDDALNAAVKANIEAAKGQGMLASNELRYKVLKSINKLSRGLLERETEV